MVWKTKIKEWLFLGGGIAPLGWDRDCEASTSLGWQLAHGIGGDHTELLAWGPG